jgi:hypothetical protein
MAKLPPPQTPAIIRMEHRLGGRAVVLCGDGFYKISRWIQDGKSAETHAENASKSPLLGS